MKPIKILDIGARGGASTIFPHFIDNSRFEYYLKRKTFNIIGVEPDVEEKNKLIKSGAYNNVFPTALFEKDGSCELYITRSKDCSSILRPNPSVIEKIIDKDWWANFEVIDKISIKTNRLDTFCRENKIEFDLLKIDVQGVEYEVVKSGLNDVEKSIGIIAELNTIPWYFDQRPLDDFVSLVKCKGFVMVAKNYKSHIPTESDYLFVKKLNKIYNREDLLKILFLLFIFFKQNLFVVYAVKGFFRGLLSFSDMYNIFYKKRRRFFLVNQER